MRLVGLSINISKQSIITAVLYPNEPTKHCDIVLCKASHVDQEIKRERRTSIMTLVTTVWRHQTDRPGQDEEHRVSASSAP